MTIEMRLLGGFGLSSGADTLALKSRKAKALMAYLALYQDEPQQREQLAAMLWEDRTDGQARQNLRQCLTDIRRVLGDHADCLAVDGDTIMLIDDVVLCDVEAFLEKIESSRIEEVTDAVGLYQGRMLEGLNPRAQLFDDWLAVERERIDQLAVRGLERLMASHRDASDEELAIQRGRALLRIDPVREDIHRELMMLLHRQGRSAEALKQYQSCRDVLERELGVPPEPETHALHTKITAARRRPRLESVTERDAQPAPVTRAPELRPATVLAVATQNLHEAVTQITAAELDEALTKTNEIVSGTIRHFTACVPRADDEMTVAVLGIPRADGYEIVSAVQAALELRDRLADISPFTFGVAVSSGQLMVRYGMDERTSTVSGQLLNQTAELAARAEPGDVIAPSNLVEASSVPIEHTPLEEPTLPDVCCVVSLGAFIDAEETPLAGRRLEIQQLRMLWQACRETGTGRAVLVRAQSGMGKTRLVNECIKEAKAAGMTIAIAQTREALAGSESALAGLTRSLLGIKEEVDEGWLTSESLAARGLGDDDTNAMAAFFDLPGAPEIDVDTAKATMARLIDHVAAPDGLLMVLEDVHWADTRTLARIADLIAISSEFPLLLILTTRLEDEPLDPAWRGALLETPLTTIDLGPLSAREARDLASHHTNRTDLIDQCVERAGGHPLFLEQLLRAGLYSSDHVPLSVQALVDARMGQFEEPERRAVKTAAVLGEDFPRAVLDFALEGAEFDLSVLQEQRMLRQAGDRVAFVHGLIRDAIYDNLLERERVVVHEKAAEWFADHNAVQRARHLVGAGASNAAAVCLELASQERAANRPELADELVRLANEAGPSR